MRSTPISKDLPSPAEILHGRPVRTINGQAPAQQIDLQDIKMKLIQWQQKYAEHYNQQHRTVELPELHEQENVLIQHHNGNWEKAIITQCGPEPRSYLCTTLTGKVFRRNRRHIHQTGMPDAKPKADQEAVANPLKSCIKKNKPTPTHKAVSWSDTVYITADAEAAYYAATQGIQLHGAVPQPNHPNPPSATPEPALPPVAAIPVPAVPTEVEGTDEDNQSHLSGSEGDGYAEESFLTPDEQDIGVVPKQTLEKCPSADNTPDEQDIGVVSMTLEKRPSAESTSSEQEVPAAAPRRSKRNVKKVNLQLPSKWYKPMDKPRGKKK